MGYGLWGMNKRESECKSKRGRLAPLMTEEEKQKGHIQELSFDFGCRMARLYQYLTEDSEYKEFIFSKQIVRCGTSVGANVREAHHAQSDADFLSKLSIASKEADETDYRLNLLHDNGYLSDSQFDSLNADCQRLNKILSSIIKKVKLKFNTK